MQDENENARSDDRQIYVKYEFGQLPSSWSRDHQCVIEQRKWCPEDLGDSYAARVANSTSLSVSEARSIDTTGFGPVHSACLGAQKQSLAEEMGRLCS